MRRLCSYEQLLIRREMGNTEQFVWCKNPICTSGQVHKPGRESAHHLQSLNVT